MTRVRWPDRAESCPQPIRVEFVLDEIATPRAGTEQQLLMLLEGLDRRLVTPAVTVLRGSDFVQRWPVQDCPVTVLNLRSVKSLAGLAALFSLSRRLDRSRADIVHVLLNDAAITVPVCARLAGSRVIAARRDLGFWHSPLLRRLLRTSNRFVDRIVVNSQAVHAFVADVERFPPERIVTIANGFDERRLELPAAALRREQDIPPTAITVGLVANLNPWKRQRDLLSALAVLQGEGCDAHAVLLGTGPDHDALARLASELGVADRVHLLGSIPEPVPYVKALDVAVLCSESEGASNALIEYLACDRPVVMTATPGNETVAQRFRPSTVPVRYAVGDVRALATSIRDQAARGRRIGGARAPAALPFDRRAMLRAYEALYCELAGGTARRRARIHA